MTIFRKLIIRTWLQSFIGSMLALILLLTIGNLLSGLLRNNVTPFEVLINHFIQLFDYLPRLFPVSGLIASLFAVNKLINRNEMTALFSLGLSRFQFLMTIFLLSGCVAFVQFTLVGFVQPLVIKQGRELLAGSSKKFRNLDKKGIRASTLNTGKTWFRNENYFFSFETYDPIRKTLNKPTFFFTTPEFKTHKIVRAKRAVYFKDHIWNLEGVSIIDKLDTEGFSQKVFYKTDRVTLEETPESFRQIEADIKILDLKSLYLYVKKLQFAKINTAAYEIILYQKISSSILTILFSLLSSIAIFSPNRRASSFGKSIFMVVAFTIVYWLLDSYAVQLGTNNIISPALISFALPFAFSLYIALFYYFHRKVNL